MRHLGMIFLAIFLLLFGISAFVGLGGLSILVPICAIIAGILILLGR
jgi:hypothetical protein